MGPADTTVTRHTKPKLKPSTKHDVHPGSPPDTKKQSASLYEVLTEMDDDFVPKLQLPAPKVQSSLAYTGASTVQCRIANTAYNHAAKLEHTISDALAKSGLSGAYLIQAGFNEELVSSGMGTLEEIYIFLDCKLPTGKDLTAILNQLRRILAPFPCVVYTPQDTHYTLPEEDPTQYLQIAKDAGIYTRGLEFAKNPADTSSSSIQGIGSGHSGGLESSRGESSSSNRDVNKGGDGHGGGGDDDDDNDKGNSGSNNSGRYRRPERHEPKSLSIPFVSEITIKDDRKEPLSTFTAIAGANIKLVESPRRAHDDKSTSYPDGWYGPWFKAQIPSVSTSFSNVDISRGSPYRLNVTQMRIIASCCPCSFLSISPENVSSIDEAVKLKSERNTTGGAWATLKGPPELKVGGTVSHVSGQETSERKWDMMMFPSTRDDAEKWVMWKYVLNERHPNASTPTETFKPGPEVEFGYDLHSRRPRLEVELVMYWSTFSGPKGDALFQFRQWFNRNRGKEDAKAPAGFANLFHQVSVCVDLEGLTSNGWVVNLNPKEADEAKLSDMRGGEPSQFEPVKVKASSEDSRLECEVVLRRALHGRIQLRRDDRTNKKSLPPQNNNTSSLLSPRNNESGGKISSKGRKGLK